MQLKAAWKAEQLPYLQCFLIIDFLLLQESPAQREIRLVHGQSEEQLKLGAQSEVGLAPDANHGLQAVPVLLFA